MMTHSEGENSSSKTQQFEISFATPNKGKPLLIHENHIAVKLPRREATPTNLNKL